MPRALALEEDSEGQVSALLLCGAQAALDISRTTGPTGCSVFRRTSSRARGRKAGISTPILGGNTHIDDWETPGLVDTAQPAFGVKLPVHQPGH